MRYLLEIIDEVLPLDKEIYEKVMRLNASKVEIRYPDMKMELTKQERDEAIELAQSFMEIVKQNVGFSIE